MFSSFGWAVLRSSLDAYEGTSLENVDRIDDLVDGCDKELWSAFRIWMEQRFEPDRWTFTEQLNNVEGVLLFVESKNHGASKVFDMLEWIATHGTGSYGLFYVCDVETSNEFRVWKVARGEVTEHADPFLSPIVPTIFPNELC